MTRALRLRPLRVDDAAAMAAVLAHPSLYEHTGGEPPTVAELERRYAIQVRGASADGRETWINAVVELDGGPIGYVQATIAEGGREAEVAWVIGRAWQGRGHARSAAALLVDGLAQRGVRTLVAHVRPGHVASERIATSLGMAPTDAVLDGEVRWQGNLPG